MLSFWGSTVLYSFAMPINEVYLYSVSARFTMWFSSLNPYSGCIGIGLKLSKQIIIRKFFNLTGIVLAK